MKIFKIYSCLIFAFILFVLPLRNAYAGAFPVNETDLEGISLFAFYDLRERESFLQVTNAQALPSTLHIQIYNVGNLCNENDFFDEFTGNDTHVYNMRDIITNDGNPSGVDLPDNAYGIVAIASVAPFQGGIGLETGALIGNFRILDNLGYEYRTNMTSFPNFDLVGSEGPYYANFNQNGNVSLSDIVGVQLALILNSGVEDWVAANIINNFVVMDIDIVDNNEVLLSCRDIIFACVKPEDPLVEEILANNDIEGTNGASVASFEYGINNAIPNSKGGELLCPGNVITEGIVVFNLQGVAFPDQSIFNTFPIFIGLNNGNGRGSMDTLWDTNGFVNE